MFKFGRPNKLYDPNCVQNFLNNYSGMTFVSGATMNYRISVDPAMPADFIVRGNDDNNRYAIKDVYGSQPGHRITYWSDGAITRWDDEL